MVKVTGTVKNGVVLPDEPLDLPDGTSVLVEIPAEIPAKEWLARFAGIWRDDPGIEAWVRERSNARAEPDDSTP